MPLIPVTEPADVRLRDYVSLRDASLRRSLETERGLFIAEGEKVIRRAVEAGHRPRSFLLAERWLAGLADVLARHPEAPVYVVTEALAERVTGFHVHRGALASLERGEPASMGDLLGLSRLVVAEDIVDHTNVGAIIRNAAGLGWDGVLLAPRAADPLYRRAIKVSMGTVFSLPWARIDDWEAAVPALRASGFTVAALALSEGAVTLEELVGRGRPEKLALLVGTEGAGLSERWVREADVVVRIPMEHGVDSLNVAAATAVACWALR
ncbi:RNA methyltransferase [Nigerium sp.]|uniref:TrmH family RNA methyltransferase n=1 Tax=Nigerium sp. TaxID=2042655 RepID=UPI00322206CB